MSRFQVGEAWVALHINPSQLAGGKAKREVERAIGTPQVKTKMADQRRMYSEKGREHGTAHSRGFGDATRRHGFLGGLVTGPSNMYSKRGREHGGAHSKGFEEEGRRRMPMVGNRIGRGLAGSMLGTIGGIFAASAVFKFIGNSLGEAREAEKAGKATAQVIKSTGGAAGLSQKQIEDYAMSLSNMTGIDDEVIQHHENLMLTFTNVKGKVFKDSIPLIEDMSVALGQDGSKSAIQLGKALNDPVKGITALRRVGVSFNETQQKTIKNLVAHGKLQQAQKLILREVTKEFGGQAAAQATAGDKARVAIKNMQEEIGKALLPLVNKLAVFVSTKLAPAISSFVHGLTGAVEKGSAFNAFGLRIRGAFKWLAEHPNIFKALAIGLGALIVVATAWNVVAGIMAIVNNAAFLPFTIIAVAVIALGVAFYFAYTRFAWFRTIVQLGARVMVAWWRLLGQVGIWLWTHIGPAFRGIGSVFVWLWAHVIVPGAKAIIAIWRVTAAIGHWLYSTLASFFRAIASVFVWLWAHVILPGAKAAITWWRLMGSIGRWLYNTLAAFFRAIGSVFVWLWSHVIIPGVKTIQLWWRILGAAASFLYNHVLHPIFNAIAAVWTWVRGKIQSGVNLIKGAWHGMQDAGHHLASVIKGIGSAVVGFWNSMKDKTLSIFHKVRDGIGVLWDSIRARMRDPIAAVVDIVYMKGIRALWNATVGKIPGIKDLPPLSVPHFASGGAVTGGVPGRDSVLGMLMPNEHVWTADEVNKFGGHGKMMAARKSVRSGEKDFGMGVMAPFAPGGPKGGHWYDPILHGASSIAKKVKDMALGSIISTLKPLIDGTRRAISNVTTDAPEYTKVAQGLPLQLLNAAVSYLTSQDVAPMLNGVGWQGPLGGAVPYIIQVMKRSKLPFSVTSTTRNEPGSYHGTGNAVDFIGPNMTKIAQYWYGMSGALLEEIHSPSWFVKKGKRVNADFYRAVYAQHFNHVHIAATKRAMQGILAGSFSSMPGSHTNLMLRALALVHRPSSWLGPLNTLITRESGWNPRAINLTDSNARAGHPSQGLMQTIPSTFAAYRLRSLPNSITDPLANIVAGLRYIIARYGTIFNVQQAVGSTPHGYDEGGWLMPKGVGVNHTRKPEPVFTDGQWQILKGNLARPTGDIYVTLDLKDVKDVRDVIEFMEKIQKTARAGARKR